MSRRTTLRQTPSLTSLNSNPHSNAPSRRVRVRRTSHLETAAEIEAVLAGERSYGELDAYPLKRHSSLCKATGGGRWEPKPVAVHPGYRIPGCKAPFEEEMEREEAEEMQRRANPIVQDGGQLLYIHYLTCVTDDVFQSSDTAFPKKLNCPPPSHAASSYRLFE